MAGILEPIDRIAFLDGQTLSARDFNDQWRNEARYRAMHNRYLHRTWGIALGLEASIAAGGRAAVVEPGYAIDSAGNDVLLLGQKEVAVPDLPLAQVFMLAIAAGGVCEWWPAKAWVTGPHVPLLAAWAQNGAMAGAVDFDVRRYAHSMAIPRMAAGSTEARHTRWKAGAGPAVWIEAVVDTSDGGFVASPQYFVEADPSGAQVFIVRADPQSFTARMLSGAVTAAQAEAAGWTIHWLGIESGGDS
jgi:hypothetical protein